jgi:hypothetical protein
MIRLKSLIIKNRRIFKIILLKYEEKFLAKKIKRNIYKIKLIKYHIQYSLQIPSINRAALVLK